MKPLIEPLDAAERLSPDDMATRREAEFLADAMAGHQRAAGASGVPRGVCAYCGRQCLLSTWVYCDTQCREEHEEQLARQARQTGRHLPWMK